MNAGQTDYRVGDYVVAQTADDDWLGYTFKITEFTRNRFGAPLVKVVNIADPDGPRTSFYPGELSWEDGSRPEVDRKSWPPASPVVNRGAW